MVHSHYWCKLLRQRYRLRRCSWYLSNKFMSVWVNEGSVITRLSFMAALIMVTLGKFQQHQVERTSRFMPGINSIEDREAAHSREPFMSVFPPLKGSEYDQRPSRSCGESKLNGNDRVYWVRFPINYPSDLLREKSARWRQNQGWSGCLWYWEVIVIWALWVIFVLRSNGDHHPTSKVYNAFLGWVYDLNIWSGAFLCLPSFREKKPRNAELLPHLVCSHEWNFT